MDAHDLNHLLCRCGRKTNGKLKSMATENDSDLQVSFGLRIIHVSQFASETYQYWLLKLLPPSPNPMRAGSSLYAQETYNDR